MINIKSDSRKVKKGDVFVALKGINSDGDKYILSAIKNGASKIIVDNDSTYDVETIKVPDTRIYLEQYLNNNYNKYLKDMNIIGITGTNGKTTAAFLIYQALNKLGRKCAYIGTIGYYLDKKVMSLPNTSPDVCDLYDLIINAYDKGYKNIIMEASSQGLAMDRFQTIKFDYAIFTNLTQDHLDYHKTMEDYALAKQNLFNNLNENGKSIINIDSKYKNYFEIGNVISYGFNDALYKVESYKLGYKTSFKLNIKGVSYSIVSSLIGKYNIYNLVSAIVLLSEMGIETTEIIKVVETLSAPPGRMDIINYKNNLIIIDYAHTPDAMKNIYDTIKEIKEGNVYSVFGCTGNRDRAKRPLMMELSDINSNYTIITSDDLHDEEFSDILSDMLEYNKCNNYEVIPNRSKAIQKGISLLKNRDILLILGKGHEECLIVKDKKIPFNDREEVNKLIKNYINV